MRAPYEQPRDVSDYSPQENGAHCSICPLNNSRYVPGELGSSGEYDVKKLSRKPKLIIVGEGPGYTEQILRRPFLGRSGRLLDATLTEAGLSREDCFVSNSHMCLPQSDEDAERAAECCAPRLHRELAALDPSIPIVALGKAAAVSILGVKSILLARGFVWTARPLENSIKSVEGQIRKADKNKAPRETKSLLKRKLEIVTGRHALAGRTILPTIHPAFVLRSDTWNAIMAIDFDRISRWVRGKLRHKDLLDNVRAVKHPEDLKRQGDYYAGDRKSELEKAFKRLGPVVSCDIETTYDPPTFATILCIGVSDGKFGVVSGPWDMKSHAPFLNRMLRGRTVVMHNGYGFDQIAMKRDGATFEKVQLEDTLIAHHAFASHFPQKLDHVVSTFCDSSPWKVLHGRRGGEEKGLAPQDMEFTQLAEYNIQDCFLCVHAWLNMQKDLDGERPVYEHDKELSLLCKDMTEVGIQVDVERKDLLVRLMQSRALSYRLKMRKLAKKPDFRPSHLNEVRHILFKTFRAPLIAVTEKGTVSTSNATLEVLKASPTRVGKFARLMLRWRIVTKINGTYCNTPEAPIWMADGTFKRLKDVRKGDAVMGWVSKDPSVGRGKAKYQSAVVQKVLYRQAKIVKVTLASGRTLHCTEDHLWLNGIASGRIVRGYWRQAQVGTSLAHVVDVPKTLDSELSGKARWLGGVFDGEGSVAKGRIYLTQSPTHNPLVCSAIEKTLRDLNLRYRKISPTKNASCNNYVLSSRQQLTSFINWCQPVLIEKASRALRITFTAKPDPVVDVQPCGRSSVISMTTSTGNYIAWGYASKNCKPVRLDEFGRTHYSWRPFGTVSGRLASRAQSNPRWSKAVEDRPREIYVAPEGKVLIYHDISQAESRIAAYMSADPIFIGACAGDVHTGNALVIFPFAKERLERDSKGKNCPRHSDAGSKLAACDCGKDYRDMAKTAGFAVAYGASADTVLARIRASGGVAELIDVENMLDKLKESYAVYYKYAADNLEFVKKNGYLRTALTGRIRWFGFFPKPEEIYNFPIQSAVADVMNLRLIDICKRLPPKVRLIMQIHDAAVFEAEGTIIKNEKGKDVPTGRAAEIYEMVKDMWSRPMPFPESIVCRKACDIPLPIDLKVGRRWSDFG